MICPRCGTQAGLDQESCARCAGRLVPPPAGDGDPVAVVVAPTRRGELRQLAEGTQTISMVGLAKAKRAAAAPPVPVPVAVPVGVPEPAAPSPWPVAPPPPVSPAPNWGRSERDGLWPPPPLPPGPWPQPPRSEASGSAGVSGGAGLSGSAGGDWVSPPAAPTALRVRGGTMTSEGEASTAWPVPPAAWGAQSASDLPPTYYWQALFALLVPPVGLFALYFSLQVGKRAAMGDGVGALRASRLTRSCCLLAAVIGALAVLVVVGLNPK